MKDKTAKKKGGWEGEKKIIKDKTEKKKGGKKRRIKDNKELKKWG